MLIEKEKDSDYHKITKAELHPQKYFLCAWWNMKDVIQYELMEHERTNVTLSAS